MSKIKSALYMIKDIDGIKKEYAELHPPKISVNQEKIVNELLSTENFYEALIYLFAIRYLGKISKIFQGIIKTPEHSNILNTIFNFTSSLMHFHSVKFSEIEKYVKSLNTIMGSKIKVPTDISGEITTDILIESIASSSMGVNVLENEIVNNFIKSIKVRIMYEKRIYITISPTSSISVSKFAILFGTKSKQFRFFDVKEKEECEKLRNYYSRYAFLFNNLSHITQNNFYIFISINDRYLSVAESEIIAI